MKTITQLFSISLLTLMTACNGQVKKEEKDPVIQQAIGELEGRLNN